MADQQSVQILRDPAQIQAMAQPLRIQVMEALREPNSAAAVSRALGRSRQSVNYHVNELKRVGLIRHTGERRRGNFVEQLYQAVARRFLVSPHFAWDSARLEAALADQTALAQLSSLGTRVAAEAQVLLDRATFDPDRTPSLTVETEIRFADEQARNSFMKEYAQSLRSLARKYGSRNGEPFRLVTASYPKPEPDA